MNNKRAVAHVLVDQRCKGTHFLPINKWRKTSRNITFHHARSHSITPTSHPPHKKNEEPYLVLRLIFVSPLRPNQ